MLHSTLRLELKIPFCPSILLLNDGINKIILKRRLLTYEMLLAVSLFFLANIGPDIKLSLAGFERKRISLVFQLSKMV